MKIVGFISDSEELSDLEQIAKVFVVGQRIRDLPHPKKMQNNLRRGYAVCPRRPNICSSEKRECSPVLAVRGLN